MEVDTPILSQAAPTAPYLDSFSTPYHPSGEAELQRDVYLHTSPEFAMKRLLAAGSGSIYQIAHVFRNGEQGRFHDPEFTMLEWYRDGFSLSQLMQEVDELLQQVAGQAPAFRFSYAELFERYLDIDCFAADTAELQQLSFQHIASLPAEWQTTRDGWLELLMSEVIEPQLAELAAPVFVVDYPASQAQLAKLNQNEQGRQVAARFELYAGGMELANGYDELCDAAELEQRFNNDNQQRLANGQSMMPVDQRLLAAMQAGLPECSGVALGLDRLMLLISQAEHIQQVKSFSFEKS